MLEVITFRKNKVDLGDYDHSKDIQNRLLMAEFSPLEVQLLEEILFSSLTIPIASLAGTLEIEEKKLIPLLQHLSQTELFKIVGNQIQIDKEMRKYFELHLQRFEEDFAPGMEFLQGLLRQVPIHVLPNWYSIPRTSNNIFESIVEKYLHSPQAFQRYLLELQFTDPVQRSIMQAVYQAPHCEVDADDLMKKHQLTEQKFEEHLLYLELTFICSYRFKKEGNHFKRMVVPFAEWQQYLCFCKESLSCPVKDEKSIERKKVSDFAFVEELSALLKAAAKQPLALESTSEDLHSLSDKTFKALKRTCEELSQGDLHHLINKLCTLGFATIEKEKLIASEEGIEWLELSIPERALMIYRSPLHRLSREDLPQELQTERALREAEKSLQRSLDLGWIYLDDFIKSTMTSLGEHHAIVLKKAGRHWKYQLPHYSEEEIDLFKAVITEWLFEVGITAVGTHDGRDCFTATVFARDLLGNE